jgi:hypothetical protein
LEEAVQVQLKALTEKNELRRKRKKMKGTSSNAMAPIGEDESKSATFQEFRDKWEPKFYKWESILEELEQMEMSQSDIVGHRGIDLTEGVNNVGKARLINVEVETSKDKLGKTVDKAEDKIGGTAHLDTPEAASTHPQSPSPELDTSDGNEDNDDSKESGNTSQ